MGYDRSLISAWDMSNINPPDVGWRNLGNDGVGVGLVAATDIVDGIAGGMATEFDGTEFVDVAASADFNFGLTSFSVAFWMKPAGIVGINDHVINHGGAGVSLGWNIQQTNDTLTSRINDGSAVTFSSAAVLLPGTWAHVIAVYDRSLTGRMYINGALSGVPVDISGEGDIEILAVLTFGGNNVHGAPYFGVLDDIRIYGAALTGLQCADLHSRSARGAT